MAQAALKICEICSSGPGSNLCLDCEQLFCDNCKSLHIRQKISKHHIFQDGSVVIQEVKSKCKDHNEDFMFECTTCEVLVCTSCVVGKHKGHEMSSISELLTVLKNKTHNNLQSKYRGIKETIQELEMGLSKIEKDVATVNREATDEGEKIKALIDQHVQNIIAYVREKAAPEKEKLMKIISKANQVLAQLDKLEAERVELQQQRNDASLIKKLNSFNNEVINVKLVIVPDLPSVVYKARAPTGNDIRPVMGSIILSELKLEADQEPIMRLDASKEKRHGYLYLCFECNQKETFDSKYGEQQYFGYIQDENQLTKNKSIRERFRMPLESIGHGYRTLTVLSQRIINNNINNYLV